MTDSLHEECGVFGIYDRDGNDCARACYYGLYALQHRGQESCGIAVNLDREIEAYKDMGLVSDVFDNDRLSRLKGDMAVAHVRYATASESKRENAQPLVLRYAKGVLAISYNGTLVNGLELRSKLEKQGAIFQTTADAEVIAYLIAQERIQCGSVEEAVKRALQYLRGAYSLLVMSPTKLIAVRDPNGFRPLSIGKLGNSEVIVSETCALDAVGATFERDILPGEMVVVTKDGMTSILPETKQPGNICIFEYIYFARPDSVIEGQSVYESRYRAGRILAKKFPVEADLVIGVPDSGLAAAMGYAAESGIPYGDGLLKNRYIGRTFIQPVQSQREDSVRIKLNVVKANVSGKRIVMIDDSIVRGTTSARLVKMLRDAGATEVHLLICSPPFRYPCYFGTDIPSRDQLIVNRHSIEEIREILGADTLGFLGMEDLKEIAPKVNGGFCIGCFSGEYPIPVPSEEETEK